MAAWEPPPWMHKAKASDTSFLEERKLHHGKLSENEAKAQSAQAQAKANDKAEVPKQSILAVLQLAEFEELFEELTELQNSKLRLIRATSREIDALRERIIYLSRVARKANSNSLFDSFMASWLSAFSMRGSRSKCEDGAVSCVVCAKFSDPEAMEERIVQIRRSKIELIRRASQEMDALKEIIRCLERITKDAETNSNSTDVSTWRSLWWLLAAIAVGCAVPVL